MRILIPLAALLIFTASCNKNKEYCWKCKVRYYYTSGQTTDDTKTICNKTEDKIKKMQGLRFESGPGTNMMEEYSNCIKNQ